MSAEIKTSFLADTKGYVKDVDKMIDALEDNEDALADLAREGDRAGEKLEDSLRDVAREAKRTGDDLDEAGSKGFRGAGDAAGEFKQEALQNFSEVTSSFDGSMSSIQDLAQGTLGGLASSGLPGIGIAAGIAAAGVGLIGGALENVADQTEASKERASEWAEKFIEAGGKVLTAAQNTAEGLDIINNRQDEVQRNVDKWGVSAEVAVAAMTGQQWALDAVAESLAGMDAEYQKALKTAQENPEGLIGPDASKLENQRAALEAGKDALSKLTNEMEAGATQADTYSRYLVAMAENTAGAEKTVDEFGDAIYSLPDGTTIYVDAETGQATQDVDAIEKKIYSLPQNTVLKVDADLSGAESKIQQFIQKDRTIRVAIDGKSYGRY